jgi:hypothetical protein
MARPLSRQFGAPNSRFRIRHTRVVTEKRPFELHFGPRKNEGMAEDVIRFAGKRAGRIAVDWKTGDLASIEVGRTNHDRSGVFRQRCQVPLV